MQCPKCGFVSFPGLEECKKCGHRFTQVDGEADGIPPLFQPLSEITPPPIREPESNLDETELSAPEQEIGDLDIVLEPQEPPPPPVEHKKEEKPASKSKQPPGLSPWQAELAERVQEYRQRRAHLRKDEEAGHKPLHFDFGSSKPKQEEPQHQVVEFRSDEESQRRPKPRINIRPAPPSFGMRSFESAFTMEDAEAASEPETPSAPQPPPKRTIQPNPEPLEIEMGSSADSSAATGEVGVPAVPIATMNMRFFAALIDAAVLVLGAGLFALVFWRVGGGITTEPLELAALGLIGAFLIVLYFAGSTAIASASPGLIWAGLEVITFEGNPPRISHCIWRGFGYLVSMSALMLGFIWAAVDAEGLTWHDRMSRTFIVPAEMQEQAAPPRTPWR